MAPNVMEPCRTRKRKRVWWVGGSGSGLNGPFRENVRVFLQEFGEVEKGGGASGMDVWCVYVGGGERSGVGLKLFVVEECVESSLLPFCNHCKFIGELAMVM